MFCCNQDNIKDNLLDYNCPVSNASTKELQSKEKSIKTTKYTDCQKPSKEIDQETNVCDKLDTSPSDAPISKSNRLVISPNALDASGTKLPAVAVA